MSGNCEGLCMSVVVFWSIQDNRHTNGEMIVEVTSFYICFTVFTTVMSKNLTVTVFIEAVKGSDAKTLPSNRLIC